MLSVLLLRQCNKSNEYKDEINRLENNLLAANDTLKNYKDGKYNVAEMMAMQLKIDELADSLKLERGKTPITIIKYVSVVNDSLSMPVTVIHDTMYIDNSWSDKGIIAAKESSVFVNSSRSMSISVPYLVNCETGLLESSGDAEVELSQNIWVESSLYKDKKGYTYIRLRTDYPSCTFNDGAAILVADKKSDYKSRKQFGVGLGVQVGYGASFWNSSVRLSPYIGVGISINWNPRFLQF